MEQRQATDGHMKRSIGHVVPELKASEVGPVPRSHL